MAGPPDGEPDREAPHPPAPLLPMGLQQRATTGRRTFGVLLALIVGLSLYLMWPLRAPLFLAAVFASVLRDLHGWLARKLRGHRKIAAVLTTLGLLIVMVGPVAALTASAAHEVTGGLAFLHDELGVQSVGQLRSGSLPPRGQAMLDRGLAALHLSRAQLDDYTARASSAAEGAAQRVVESSSRAVFHGVILLIAFYFLLVEADRLGGWLWRISPLDGRQTESLLAEFRNVTRASILGTAITSLFQAAAATLGYLLAGVPRALFFGMLTLFASFIPVIGTVLIWMPAALLLWLFGHHGASILLLAWCLVFVVGTEHLGKPFLLKAVLRGGGEMHTGLVFLGLVGGVQMFGLIGLVLGPLVLALLVAFLRIYERDFNRGNATVH